MMQAAGGYLIAMIIGIAIGALSALSYSAIEDSRQRERAVAERERLIQENAKHNQEVVDGWSSAVTYLRGRLADGWRPKIPRTPGVPASDLPTAPGKTDGEAADGLSSARRELAACSADKERLIMDGAETTLQLMALQDWIRGVK